VAERRTCRQKQASERRRYLTLTRSILTFNHDRPHVNIPESLGVSVARPLTFAGTSRRFLPKSYQTGLSSSPPAPGPRRHYSVFPPTSDIAESTTRKHSCTASRFVPTAADQNPLPVTQLPGNSSTFASSVRPNPLEKRHHPSHVHRLRSRKLSNREESLPTLLMVSLQSHILITCFSGACPTH
jgi:hypothetical protein